ncbi:SLATT domain-containing protein [Streptomyces sp. NPDC057460]|uniref:SLATT domain-containing protein n=1 Tax=Streptomyces sp. NPDC057460 TaxID=3346141 RepID=UPI0036CF01FD
MWSRGVPDLSPLAWKGLPPTRNQKLATLAELYALTESTTLEAANWYLRRRVSPSRKSKALRATAAISVVIGALLPLIHSAAPSWVNAEWGFIFLALGGGAVLFDRTFGYSASWTRYVRAGLTLQRLVANSQIEFTKIYIATDVDCPTDLEIEALLQVIERLQKEASEIVQEETNSWTGYLTESVEELTRTTVRHTEMSPHTRRGDVELR